MVGKPLNFRHVVADIENRQRQRLVQPLKVGQDLVLRYLVQCRERLVHQQELGVREQGAADRQALSLAAGEIAGRAVQQLIDPEQLDHFVEVDAFVIRGRQMPVHEVATD